MVEGDKRMKLEPNPIMWVVMLNGLKDDDSEDAQRLKQFALEQLEKIKKGDSNAPYKST